MDCSPSGSSVHGILQAEILVWVAFLSAGDFPNPGIKPSSPALQADSLLSEPPRKRQKISSVLVHSFTSNSATPWTIVHQAPLSMEFSSQEHWNTAISSSKETFQSRYQTRVSRIAGRFFTI